MTAEFTPDSAPAAAFPLQFLSLSTAATVAGVSRDAVVGWVGSGRLRAIRIADDQWRVERGVLEAFLRVRPASLTAVQRAS